MLHLIIPLLITVNSVRSSDPNSRNGLAGYENKYEAEDGPVFLRTSSTILTIIREYEVEDEKTCIAMCRNTLQCICVEFFPDDHSCSLGSKCLLINDPKTIFNHFVYHVIAHEAYQEYDQVPTADVLVEIANKWIGVAGSITPTGEFVRTSIVPSDSFPYNDEEQLPDIEEFDCVIRVEGENYTMIQNGQELEFLSSATRYALQFVYAYGPNELVQLLRRNTDVGASLKILMTSPQCTLSGIDAFGTDLLYRPNSKQTSVKNQFVRLHVALLRCSCASSSSTSSTEESQTPVSITYSSDGPGSTSTEFPSTSSPSSLTPSPSSTLSATIPSSTTTGLNNLLSVSSNATCTPDMCECGEKQEMRVDIPGNWATGMRLKKETRGWVIYGETDSQEYFLADGSVIPSAVCLPSQRGYGLPNCPAAVIVQGTYTLKSYSCTSPAKFQKGTGGNEDCFQNYVGICNKGYNCITDFYPLKVIHCG